MRSISIQGFLTIRLKAYTSLLWDFYELDMILMKRRITLYFYGFFFSPNISVSEY